MPCPYIVCFQMNAVSAENGTSEPSDGGPMWGRFFDSIGHEDTESMLSGSHVPPELRTLQSNTSFSHLHGSPRSEVHPNDSASVMDDESVLSYHKGTPSISAPLPVDDGTYVFKFRTPSGRTHRFQSRHDNIEHLREVVAGKLATDPFFTDFKPSDPSVIPPDPIDFLLSYTDADGDTVLITSDHDVSDAVKIARISGSDRVVLFVQGGRAWDEAGAGKSEQKAAETAAAAQKEIPEVEKLEVPLPPPTNFATPPNVPPPPFPRDDVMGIPKDLLLPASIGALAVVILGIFTFSRLSSSNY